VAAVEAPAWPSEAEEAAFLAEQRAQGAPVAPAASAAEEAASAEPLPPLAERVARIPAEVRGLLEELFRAKFTGVKRLPEQALDPRAAAGQTSK